MKRAGDELLSFANKKQKTDSSCLEVKELDLTEERFNSAEESFRSITSVPSGL